MVRFRHQSKTTGIIPSRDGEGCRHPRDVIGGRLGGVLWFINAKKTYNSGDSLVVTDPTTNPPVSGLTMGERTGSRIFHYLWSYVPIELLYKHISCC